MILRTLLVAGIAATVFAGCSGGSSSVLTTGNPSPGQAAPQSVRVTLDSDLLQSLASNRRGAQFVFDGSEVAVEVPFAAGLLARWIGGQKGGRRGIGLAPPLEKPGHDGVPFA